MGKRVTEDFVRALAAHPESETLDVKGDQYRIKGANAADKSEVLKDILAFANGFAPTDAYILIGVQERKPPPHEIAGISNSIDDASLQQLANAKLINCPDFSYEEVSVDGATICVIRIPPQSGPFLAKRDFGQLKQSEVLVRQGTTTLRMSVAKYQQRAIERDRSTTLQQFAPQLSRIVDEHLKESLISLPDASGTVKGVLDRCKASLRAGDIQQALSEVESALSDLELIEQLSDRQHAKILHTKAHVLLRAGDLQRAKAVLEAADEITPELEPLVRSMLALYDSGIDAALQVLGEPRTDEGRQLAAQLCVLARRPNEALQMLAADDSQSTAKLRPRALALLLLNDRAGALDAANELLRREPSWLESSTTAGIAHFHSSLSPAFRVEQVAAPDVVPPPLVKADPKAIDHLRLAERHFRSALERPMPHVDLLNVQIWLLATLTLLPGCREDANQMVTSILHSDPTNVIAVLWATSYSLDFDRARSSKHCQISLAGPTPSASSVITYLLLEPSPTEETLSFLQQHKELFQDEGEIEVFKRWHHRLQEEVHGPDPDAPSSSLRGLVQKASEASDWHEVEQLLADNPDDSILLAIVADLLGEVGEWNLVARFAKRLLSEVATEFAYRLVGTALLNTGDSSGCIEVVREWEGKFSKDELPSVEFWRLKSTALSQVGDVAGAIDSVTTLLSQSHSPNDISHAANLFLRVGDVRSAAPHIASLVRQDEVSPDHAINWSRAVQHDDQELAEALLDAVARKGVPDASAGAAYEMAMRLRRDDLSTQFLSALSYAADSPGTSARSASLEETLTWMRDYQTRASEIGNLTLQGIVPLAIGSSGTNQNVALRFEEAFASIDSKRWDTALMAFSGGRPLPDLQLPRLDDLTICMDLTTLLVLDEIELLDSLHERAKSIRFPFELPGALLELEDGLGRNQPSRIDVLESIAGAEEAGSILSSLDDLTDIDESAIRRVVFDASNNSRDWPEVDIHQLVQSGVARGRLDQEAVRSILKNFPSTLGSSDSVAIPDQPILVFDSNTVEIALEAFGLERLLDFGSCVVEPDYLRIIRDELQLADLKDRAKRRLARLRKKIAEGLRLEQYTLMPQVSVATAGDHKIRNSLEATLFSLLSQPGESGCVIAFDDRALNKHPSTSHNPIVCTLELLQCMTECNALTVAELRTAKEKLRDRNLFFVELSADDVSSALSKAEIAASDVVESPRMRRLRRFASRSRSLHQYLNLQQHDQLDESPVAISSFRLASSAIETVFENRSLARGDGQARANWIWRHLQLKADRTLPLHNRNAGSVKALLAVQGNSLLSSALTRFLTSAHPDRLDQLKFEVEWAWNECVAPQIEGNPDLVVLIANHFRKCTAPLLDGTGDTVPKSKREIAERFARAHISQFVMSLPDRLQLEILRDQRFASRLGITSESTVEIRGVAIKELEFHKCVIHAIRDGGEIHLDTSGGLAFVRVVHAGSRTRPAILQFSGALSLKYEEPILSILTAKDWQSLNRLLRAADWLDSPDHAIDDLQRDLERLTDIEAFRLLEVHRQSNVQIHYRRLADSFERGIQLTSDDFEIPNPALLLGSMRLPTRTRKRVSFLIDIAAESLIKQYGPFDAFERLCGLPIDLVSRFYSSIEQAIKKHPRKTKAWLLETSGSILARTHKLALCAALVANGEISVARARKSIQSLLEEWSTSAPLFTRILHTYNQRQSLSEALRRLQPAQRLIIVWSHADRIARISNEASLANDQTIGFFEKIANRTLVSQLTIDSTYDSDAANPELLSASNLLLFAISYIQSKCPTVFSSPLYASVNRLLRIEDCEDAPLNLRLLQGRQPSFDLLESFLLGPNESLLTELDSNTNTEEHRLGKLAQRMAAVSSGAVAINEDSAMWLDILAYEHRFLVPGVRLRYLEYAKEIEWDAIAESSEEYAVCVLMLVADMISYVDDEPTAIEMGKRMLEDYRSAVQKLDRSEDTKPNTVGISFSEAILEIALRMARSTEMSRSCQMLANNLQAVYSLEIGRENEILAVLNKVIPLLPVEHALPLVELQQLLKSNN